jgi:hypothetical protein
MQRLKWFLVGVVVTVFLSDWVRLRYERTMLMDSTNRAIGLADQRAKQVSKCLEAVNTGKEILDTVQVAYLARYKTIEEMDEAKDKLRKVSFEKKLYAKANTEE